MCCDFSLPMPLSSMTQVNFHSAAQQLFEDFFRHLCAAIRDQLHFPQRAAITLAEENILRYSVFHQRKWCR